MATFSNSLKIHINQFSRILLTILEKENWTVPLKPQICSTNWWACKNSEMTVQSVFDFARDWGFKITVQDIITHAFMYRNTCNWKSTLKEII